MNTVEMKTDNEILGIWQRWLEAIIVVLLLLFLGFLAYHQWANTGFFTAEFGQLEMVCLYGPLLLALVAPAIRAFTGRRNPARPFEAATSLFLALGSLWLLIAFPFDYSHLADALPGSLRVVLAWVTDDIGKLLLLLQITIGPISALLTGWKYLSIRQREAGIYPKQRPS